MLLFLTPRAQKDFNELPKPEQKKAARKLDLLEVKPLIGKKLGGKLDNLRCLRAWPYRIIYHIQDYDEIWIDHILHRQGAYK
jgi:mRNA-degrading endonuclease RelE of RelBE toxin-antitoxin system